MESPRAIALTRLLLFFIQSRGNPQLDHRLLCDTKTACLTRIIHDGS